jgi:hypothetical protein
MNVSALPPFTTDTIISDEKETSIRLRRQACRVSSTAFGLATKLTVFQNSGPVPHRLPTQNAGMFAHFCRARSAMPIVDRSLSEIQDDCG